MRGGLCVGASRAVAGRVERSEGMPAASKLHTGECTTKAGPPTEPGLTLGELRGIFPGDAPPLRRCRARGPNRPCSREQSRRCSAAGRASPPLCWRLPRLLA